MKLRIVLTACAALAASACSEKAPEPGTVPPATGASIVEYSENITDISTRAKDASLYEYFCSTALEGPCPADIDAKLDSYRSGQGESRVDVADAFIRMYAEAHKDPETDYITDEEYLKAAYKVAFNREPDEAAWTDHLPFLQQTGERKLLLKNMLTSQEFQSR